MRRRRRHRHPDAKGFVTPPERLFEISRLPDRMRSRLVTGPRLLVAEHNGREARYFVMVDVEGTPTLSGPEQHVHCAENSVELIWAEVHDFDRLGLQPEHLCADLVELLDL